MTYQQMQTAKNKTIDSILMSIESEYAHATVEIERLNRELVEARIMNAEQRRAQ